MNFAAARLAQSMNSSTRWFASRVAYATAPEGIPASSRSNTTLVWSSRNAPDANLRARIARAAIASLPIVSATASGFHAPAPPPSSSTRTGPPRSRPSRAAATSSSAPLRPASRASMTLCAVA